MMKRLFFVNLLLMAVVSSAMAQQAAEPRNPVRGYVITNDNDTLWGTIDYLTGKENAEACHFQKDGETTYRIYRPGEIQGYRLHEGGVYYVTRTLPIDSVETLTFAEFILQGGISLYRYEDDDRRFYYMVDSKGKIAVMRAVLKQDEIFQYGQDLALKRRRDNLKDAMEMVSDSYEAALDIWRKETTASNLKTILRRYNEKFCKEAGDCVEFQYNGDKAKLYTAKLILETGFCKGHMRYDNGFSTSSQMYHVAVGCELGSLRKHPNLSHQIMAVGELYDKPVGVYGIYTTKESKLWFEINYGLIYRFPTIVKNRPFVCGGISVSAVSGVYAGAGYEFGLGHHLLRVSLKGRYRALSLLKEVAFEDFEMGSMTTASLDFSFVL